MCFWPSKELTWKNKKKASNIICQGGLNLIALRKCRDIRLHNILITTNYFFFSYKTPMHYCGAYFKMKMRWKNVISAINSSSYFSIDAAVLLKRICSRGKRCVRSDVSVATDSVSVVGFVFIALVIYEVRHRSHFDGELWFFCQIDQFWQQ